MTRGVIRTCAMKARQSMASTTSARICGVLLAAMLITGCGTGVTSKSSSKNEDSFDRFAEKGPVKLVVRVTPREPRLSDLVEMTVEVTAPPDVEIKPPAFGQAVGDFVVRDYSERKDLAEKKQPGDSTTRRYRYQLEPVHAGRHLIRSVGIEFIDRRPNTEASGAPVLIEAEPIEVNVTSELGNQIPNLADLDPMLPPRPLPGSSNTTWFIVAAVLIVTGLVVFWLRRRRHSKFATVRVQTPEEIAHSALAKLLAEDLPRQGLFKDFYLRLTGIVRHYIEGTTGLRAPEQTTEEFLRAMRSRNVFTHDRSQQLAEFLEAADMVKYAGQQPDDNQVQLSILRAKEFVERRQSQDSAIAATAGEA